jgi:transcriptional regulator with XRE-family HTH domain
MSLGREIRRRRQSAGLTQEELASRSKLSPHYLSTVENDHRDVSVSTLVQIAKALGVPPGELLGGIGGLTPDALEAARMFQQLGPEAREVVLQTMRLLGRKK